MENTNIRRAKHIAKTIMEKIIIAIMILFIIWFFASMIEIHSQSYIGVRGEKPEYSAWNMLE